MSCIGLAATYSPTSGSTIGAEELNFSVRNGKRWNLLAITTNNSLVRFVLLLVHDYLNKFFCS